MEECSGERTVITEIIHLFQFPENSQGFDLSPPNVAGDGTSSYQIAGEYEGLFLASVCKDDWFRKHGLCWRKGFGSVIVVVDKSVRFGSR